jgi:hypothetical protein
MDLAMPLARNKQQHKKITKNRKIQKDRQHTEKESREEQRPSGLTIFPYSATLYSSLTESLEGGLEF